MTKRSKVRRRRRLPGRRRHDLHEADEDAAAGFGALEAGSAGELVAPRSVFWRVASTLAGSSVLRVVLGLIPSSQRPSWVALQWVAAGSLPSCPLVARVLLELRRAAHFHTHAATVAPLKQMRFVTRLF